MKKSKIFLYHLLVFAAGSVGIAAYFFYKISTLPTVAGAASIVLLPAAVVYIAGFGIFCLISLIVWILVAVAK